MSRQIWAAEQSNSSCCSHPRTASTLVRVQALPVTLDGLTCLFTRAAFSCLVKIATLSVVGGLGAHCQWLLPRARSVSSGPPRGLSQTNEDIPSKGCNRKNITSGKPQKLLQFLSALNVSKPSFYIYAYVSFHKVHLNTRLSVKLLLWNLWK